MDIFDTFNQEETKFNKTDFKRIKKLKKDSNVAYREVLKQLRPRRTSRYINACIISSGIALGSYFYAQKPPVVNNAEAKVMHSTSVLEQKIENRSYNTTETNRNPRERLTKSENLGKTIYKQSGFYYYFPVRGDTLSNISLQTTGTMKHWPRIQRYNNLHNHIIEVNQPLKIPDDIVNNSSLLYKGNHDSRIYMAGRHDSLSSISKKVFGTTKHADYIFRYNKRLNPRFSRKIYNKEYILLPRP